MKDEIPSPIIAVLSEILPEFETHATLNSLLMYAGAPGEPPEGNKNIKVQNWLRRANADQSVKALDVLGKCIENLMEGLFDPENEYEKRKILAKEKISKVLSNAGLAYHQGGKVSPAGGLAAKSLEEAIKSRDLDILNTEFTRALNNVNANPRDAISAACNLLESICKIYIQDEGLELPPKLDIQGIWGVVRKELGLDPSQIENRDLKEILGGLMTTVHGIGALRSHNSSAHGEGRQMYRVQPRHARLAVNAAHTVALFILEVWENKKKSKP